VLHRPIEATAFIRGGRRRAVVRSPLRRFSPFLIQVLWPLQIIWDASRFSPTKGGLAMDSQCLLDEIEHFRGVGTRPENCAEEHYGS
jgi:hypothetical protein